MCFCLPAAVGWYGPCDQPDRTWSPRTAVPRALRSEHLQPGPTQSWAVGAGHWPAGGGDPVSAVPTRLARACSQSGWPGGVLREAGGADPGPHWVNFQWANAGPRTSADRGVQIWTWLQLAAGNCVAVIFSFSIKVVSLLIPSQC